MGGVMGTRIAILVIACCYFSAASYAAKPTSITFKETETNSDGTEYQIYEVKCSDGRLMDITAWNNRKLWCVGNSIQDGNCNKKQIKAAKKVCKSA